MEHLLDEIDRASSVGLHYASLLLALAVPDQCAALASEDGQTDGKRYQAWYAANMQGGYLDDASFEQDDSHQWLSAYDCYKFRCALLHQGRSDHHQASTKRLAFLPPNGMTVVHKAKFGDQVTLIDVPTFVADMTRSARAWMDSMRGTQPFERNRIAFIQPRPGGMPGAIGGATVIF